MVVEFREGRGNGVYARKHVACIKNMDLMAVIALNLGNCLPINIAQRVGYLHRLPRGGHANKGDDQISRRICIREGL